jgi:hypothetical protein
VGYRGRVEDRERARQLRAEAWTLQQIADELEASRGQVSVWVRDVLFTPGPRSRARRRAPNALQRRKQDEIALLRAIGVARIGELSRKQFLVAGTALYAGEGSKTDGSVRFANSDPRMILFFVRWLRAFFAIDEARLRLNLYLHEGLDLEAANRFWSDLTDIPIRQFTTPYRAIPDSTLRSRKHPMGCPSVVYSCRSTHRSIMGLVDALLSFPGFNPG